MLLLMLCFPLGTSAAEIEVNEGGPEVEEYSSYYDYVIVILDTGARVKVNYYIVTDGTGEHIDPNAVWLGTVSGSNPQIFEFCDPYPPVLTQTTSWAKIEVKDWLIYPGPVYSQYVYIYH